MSDRDALVNRITQLVMSQLAADPATTAAAAASLAPAASPTPAQSPAPQPKTFRHPNPADSEDRALGTQPAQRRPDAVRSFVAAGASRIGSGPGIGDMASDIASIIDHTLLKPDATVPEVTKLCEEAKRFHFASVCVNPSWVPLCTRLLRGTSVKVCTVIGFPLGASTAATKAFEARKAIREGATEVDMVLNVGALKGGNHELVYDDISGVVQAAHESGALAKVILETALLTDEEKVIACVLAKRARADFVKTSTGFSSGGATLRDVAIMRATVGPDMGVKASGGIRSYTDVVGMVQAGATRIGASAGVRIVKESHGETVAGGNQGKY